MKKRLNGSFLLALILATGANLGSIHRAEALDARYQRNGECYLSIGNGVLKGIYRLNNAVSGENYREPKKVIANNFDDTKGLHVDLDRNIYTFSSDPQSSDPVERTGNIYRQVLDNEVSEDTSDWGSWQWHHTDSRQVKAGTDIYRTNNQSGPRNIHYYYSGDPGFKALSPGNSVTLPNGYSLPALGDPTNEKDYLALRVYEKKKWYSIPNGSWYSSWHRNQYSSTSGYMVYNDTEYVTFTDYFKVKWTNNTPSSDEVSYPTTGRKGSQPVATSEKTFTQRYYVCGCLDSCQADGGSGDSPEIEPRTDIAMQPKLEGSDGDRTYSLSHYEDSSVYTLTRAIGDGGADDFSGSSNLRGDPERTDTRWIGISLKDKDNDYVYVMGNSQLKEWEQLALSGSSVPSSFRITAASVSNRWNQKGGIIYAYDKGQNCIYRYVCEDIGDKNNPGIKARTLDDVIYVGDQIVDKMGGDAAHCELDEVKADGFGNAFVALTFPSNDMSTFNPPEHFKLRNAVHMCKVAEEGNYKKLNFVFPVEYGKAVFKIPLKAQNNIEEIGKIVYGRSFYHLQIKVSNDCYADLISHDYTCERMLNKISEASEGDPNIGISGRAFCDIKDNLAPYYVVNQGCRCSGFTSFNLGDPNSCHLAVVNVPTPDEVLSLEGTSKSFLDIIGPYTDFPIADAGTTNQLSGLLTDTTSLNDSELYYYMVENYPIYTNPQDPNTEPDIDGDQRVGGFVSSIINAYPAGNPVNDSEKKGTIRYHWRTWLVQDADGNPLCNLVNETQSSQGMNFTYFYSPFKGKYILTCQVDYDWYDYDAIIFGETVDVLNDPRVRKTNEFAIPSTKGKSALQLAADYAAGLIDPVNRLNEIKASSDFSFMNGAKDINNQTIDYTQIYRYNSPGDSWKFWAMEPIVCNGLNPKPDEDTEIALVERCDDLPGVNTDNYWPTGSFWSQVPNNPGYFGLEEKKDYHWRIAIASQTNILKDISVVNGLDDRSNDYNHVAAKLYAKNNTDEWNKDNGVVWKFENEIGDVWWATNSVQITAQLEYTLPTVTGSQTASLAMPKNGVDNGSGIISCEVKGSSAADAIVVTSSHDKLFPTDPKSGKIIITMLRPYYYNICIYKNGQFLTKFPIPGVEKLKGEASVIVVDTEKPSFVWGETSPNNLFGVTGLELKDAFADGSTNPTGERQDKIEFVYIDNNPWETDESVLGLTELEEHIKNYAYNYGTKACKDYCATNSAMLRAFNNVKDDIDNSSEYPYQSSGVKGEIERLKSIGQPSSNLNLKPLFSKKARDVRLAFDTVTRNINPDANYGKASLISSNTTGLDFDVDSSMYSYNNRPSGENSYLTVAYSCESNNSGISTSTVRCSINVSDIEFGGAGNKVVPDGYANNTDGYIETDRFGNILRIHPYKFYVSAIDCSGNYSGERTLNCVLHVKDNIRPIGYGKMKEFKNNVECYLPDKSPTDNTISSIEKIASHSPYFEASAGYMTSEDMEVGSLDPRALAAEDWTTQNTNGYCANFAPNPPMTYNYMATPYLNGAAGNILTGLGDDGNFIESVNRGLPPRPVEDNIECQFSVFVNDNCGNATSTLTYKYYRLQNNGVYQEAVNSIMSTWNSGSELRDRKDKVVVNTDSNNNPIPDSSGKEHALGSDVSFTSSTVYNIFRGEDNMFPMAIPIVIEAKDNARDWDYYEPGSGNPDNSTGIWNWDINKTHFGSDRNNTRIFRTTLPVYGSQLDIRTLDKTIKNSNH